MTVGVMGQRAASTAGKVARSAFTCALLCAATLVAAQVTAPPPTLAISAQASLKAAPHPMAQRMQACTMCHGREGRATNSGYWPRIAGKPQGYLFNQLVNFRDGRRQNAQMTHLVQWMTDDYLREIAGYFAQLDLPYPPPQTATLPPAQAQRAQRLVLQGDPARQLPACGACHGARLTGVLPAVPGLIGLPRDYLLGQFGAWRQGLRRAAEPDCMAAIARRLEPAEIEAVTLWLSAQPTSADMHAAPATELPRPWPIACGSGAP